MAPGFVISFDKNVLSPSRICDLKLGFSSPEYSPLNKFNTHLVPWVFRVNRDGGVAEHL